MSEDIFDNQTSLRNRLCRWGGIASWILLGYCLITLIQIVLLGGPPATAEESFRILQEDRLVGLLRLDLPTVVAMPLYYVLFLGLYTALRRTNLTLTALSTVLIFIGITLFLTTPSVFSLSYLSDKYALASTDAQRAAYLAAGEALIASDMWHSTAALVSGVFVQAAGILICVVMLQGRVFSRLTGYVGVVTHGLDLAHILIGPFVPVAGVVLMATAGPLYLLWFPLVARRLRQIGRTRPRPASAVPAL